MLVSSQPPPDHEGHRRGTTGGGHPGNRPVGAAPVRAQDPGLPHRRGVRLPGLPHPAEDKKGTTRKAVCTYPSKKSLNAILGKVRTAMRRTRHKTLAGLLHQLNLILRGWCSYFRHGISKVTFGYLDKFAWWRAVGWLRKRHPGLNWGTVRRRLMPGWQVKTAAPRCSGRCRSRSPGTSTGVPRSRAPGQAS
jgi:hypothetical protein